MSALTILIVLHLCRVSNGAFPIVPRLFQYRNPFLHPHSVPISRSSCATKTRLSGAKFRSVGRLHSYQGYVIAVPFGRNPIIVLSRQCSCLFTIDTHNQVPSSSRTLYFVYFGAPFLVYLGAQNLGQGGAACFCTRGRTGQNCLGRTVF